jgi:hypothetical protein
LPCAASALPQRIVGVFGRILKKSNNSNSSNSSNGSNSNNSRVTSSSSINTQHPFTDLVFRKRLHDVASLDAKFTVVTQKKHGTQLVGIRDAQKESSVRVKQTHMLNFSAPAIPGASLSIQIYIFLNLV